MSIPWLVQMDANTDLLKNMEVGNEVRVTVDIEFFEVFFVKTGDDEFTVRSVITPYSMGEKRSLDIMAISMSDRVREVMTDLDYRRHLPTVTYPGEERSE